MNDQSNWDERLDTGTGDGTMSKRGRCTVCGVKYDATALLAHHRLTGHAFSYNGFPQICNDKGCASCSHAYAL